MQLCWQELRAGGGQLRTGGGQLRAGGGQLRAGGNFSNSLEKENGPKEMRMEQNRTFNLSIHIRLSEDRPNSVVVVFCRRISVEHSTRQPFISFVVFFRSL